VGALHRFEQRLEHMVTAAFARAFRSAVQPMEIAAALQREVDNSAQILSRDRRLAPNNFTIDLSPTDFDRLSTYGDTLSRELASMLQEHAQEQHYMFTGPISMNFTRADDLTTGRFRVRSVASANVTPAAGQSMTDTAVQRAPMFLEINDVRHPLDAPGVVIGRGTNADLRIDDPGVSRRHVEFRVQAGAGAPSVSIVDLGSTNGTTVNGQRVQNAVLSDGAVVQIGGTRIVVRLGGSQQRPSSGPASPPRAQPPGPPPGTPPAQPMGGPQQRPWNG
jgi:FHA domain-containing protein